MLDLSPVNRGLHPRRLHLGSAPVHRLVLAASTPAVQGPPRRHRVLRPRARGPRQVAERRWHAELCTIVGSVPRRRRRRRDRALPGGPHPPAPVDYESHVAHLDRNELGSILVTAGLSSPRDHALVSLLALNGLHVSDRDQVDTEALGLERGHRTLTVLHKGGKLVTMPLAPHVARAVRPLGRLRTGGRSGLPLDRRPFIVAVHKPV